MGGEKGGRKKVFMLGKVQWKDIGYEILHGARDSKRGLCFPQQKQVNSVARKVQHYDRRQRNSDKAK